MAQNRIATGEGRGKGPDLIEREIIYWQLGFLASAVGDMASQEEHPTENYICGLTTLLNDIADKVFPEGKE